MSDKEERIREILSSALGANDNSNAAQIVFNGPVTVHIHQSAENLDFRQEWEEVPPMRVGEPPRRARVARLAEAAVPAIAYELGAEYAPDAVVVTIPILGKIS
jgi:hypothetical protein